MSRTAATKLIRSPLDPRWLIPDGWEHILGSKIDYRLGQSVLHLGRVQFNQHVRQADPAKPHAHPHHQLLYYQRGDGILKTAGHEYRVAHGSIFVLPAQCRHQFESLDGESATCLALDFTIDESAYASLDLGGLPMDSEVAVLLSLLHGASARPFQLSPIDQHGIDRCIEDIVAENDARETGYATMIQAHLLRLIASCLRGARRATGFGEFFRHTAWRHNLIAERAVALIEEHATRHPELTLSEIAKRCGASANHLNRILAKHTGRTFHQLLLRRRLQQASALLRQGRMNCTEAAFASGFNDSNYFSRAFRKAYGYSPSKLFRR